VFQAVVLSLVAAALIAMVISTRASLEEQSLTTGFGFLERSTGWDFSFSVLPYSISDTYSKTLLIGILNTLLLGFLGIFFATLVGIVIGLMQRPIDTASTFLVLRCCTLAPTTCGDITSRYRVSIGSRRLLSSFQHCAMVCCVDDRLADRLAVFSFVATQQA